MKNTETALLTLLLALVLQNLAFAQNNNSPYNEKFKKTIASIQSSNNMTARYNNAMHYFSNELSTTFQLQDVCYYIPNDEIKYQLCITAYPKIIDKNNFFNIYDVFSTLSYAMKLYHNTQAKDESLVFVYNNSTNNPYNQNNYYSSIDFPNSDGYIGFNGVNCRLPMAQNDFNYFFNGLLLDRDDNQRLEFLKQKVATHCFSTAQIMKLGIELQLEKNRLTFLKFTLEKCFDLDNFIKSIQIINHTYYKEDLTIFIKRYLASITPIQTNTTYTNTTQTNSYCETSSSEFSHILISIKDQAFADKQKALAKKYIQKKCLTMEQLKQIVSKFSFENDRLEMIKYLYDYAPYPEQMYIFRDVLRFLISKQEFDKFIIDKQ